jgi:hypothetical protein
MNNKEILPIVESWLIGIEAGPAELEADIGLRRSLRIYSSELKYRLDQDKPYRGDLDRLHKLRQAMRSLDAMYDGIASLELPLEAEVRSALTFVNAMALDMAMVINSVEAEYPNYATAFAADRKMYSEWQAGRGPLADGPWFDDEEAATLEQK